MYLFESISVPGHSFPWRRTGRRILLCWLILPVQQVSAAKLAALGASARQMPALSGLPGPDSAEGQEPDVREQWPVAALPGFVEPPVCATYLVSQSVSVLPVLLVGSELSIAARLPV